MQPGSPSPNGPQSGAATGFLRGGQGALVWETEWVGWSLGQKGMLVSGSEAAAPLLLVAAGPWT